MNPGVFVGAGFLLGSLGVKALTSNKAKSVYVRGLVQGMRAKEEVGTMIDEARAQFDDLMAEASYEVQSAKGAEGTDAQATEGAESQAVQAAEPAEDEAVKVAVGTEGVESAAKVASSVERAAWAATTGKGSGKGGHCGHHGHGHGHGGK